jgi:CubicO group peptidase (beta-lactamase class C family)
MIKYYWFLIATVFLWINSSCFRTENKAELLIPTDTEIEKGVELIEKYLDSLSEVKKFNGAVLIAKDNKAQLISVKGYTDYTLKEELSDKSVFRLASLSKQFTAAAIMILEENKQLEYDDFVSKYITKFPYEDVSIRNLLTHTSGIPDDYIKLASRFRNIIGDTLSIKEAVELIVKNKPKQKQGTNEAFSYSNTGYVLLAGIVEQISGQSFESFLKNNLFEPLGMNNCRVWNLLSADSDFEQKTWSFKYEGKKTLSLKPNYIDGVAGDGAVFCNVTDFLIWDKFWNGNELISNANLNEAIKPHSLLNGTPSNYGFGWSVKDYKMLHTGSWLGARTFIQRNLSNNTMVVILDNSQNSHMGPITKTLSTFADQL